MKNRIHVIHGILAIYLLTGLVSCQNLLNLDSETSVTSQYLYSSKAGLQRAMTGLYAYEREGCLGGQAPVYRMEMLDYSTDIVYFRAGNAADVARLNTLNADSESIAIYWDYQYGVIGKANEIIDAALKLGTDDPEIATILGEASVMRAKSYFNLWKHFDRIYINTTPTTVDNLERVFTPASTEDVLKLIKDDLHTAVNNLGWDAPVYDGTKFPGRFTKAVAKHILAQVAMWEKDWDEAISNCEDIFNEGSSFYSLEPHIEDVFSSPDLTSHEVLYAYQFSKNKGGGGVISGSALNGHVVSIYTTSQYRSVSGCICSSDQGGYGFGRTFPNSYLLSLYGPSDTRFNTMYIHKFRFNDPTGPKYGQEIPVDGNDYDRNIHPMSIKHADFWTNQDQPTRKSSFKDLIVYRLAETSLICSEAYFHKGNNDKAIEYYNKTYSRAGNAPFTGTLTLDDLLDEYARELNFEGVRWGLLKRLGLLYERAILHSGDSRADDPLLSGDYIECRQSFVEGKHETWPIPSNQILLMGSENFPQNPSWN